MTSEESKIQRTEDSIGISTVMHDYKVKMNFQDCMKEGV